MKSNWKYLVLCLLMLPVSEVSAQDDHEAQARDVVGFLEYLLNTLGNPSTSTRDKDVIINQSYTKIFRDSTVQIEDDLDENRDVVTNKDVQAYLKDVDFFFTSAKFTFEWQEVEVSENDNGETFYKVSLLRNLEAYSIMGDTINQTLPRYIEINVDPEESDLKIASIYTNELNQDALWNEWWNNLTVEWQSIFRRKKDLGEDPSLDEIKSLENLDSLDLSGNRNLANIEALNRIRALKYLDLSGTNIEDLTPIRNLTGLQYLDISNTPVTSISGLRYAKSLKVFNLENAPVGDISVVSRMPHLEHISVAGTFVTNFSPLTGLTRLTHLEAANTDVNSFETIDSLRSLEILDLKGTKLVTLSQLSSLNNLNQLKVDSTQLLNIDGIEAMPSLSMISLNNTRVADLTPAIALTSLERMYCDYTGITNEQALEFKRSRPEVLIIFESEEMIDWWNALSPSWKSIFQGYVPTNADVPTKEQLAQMEQLTAINLNGDSSISDFVPLEKLQSLEEVRAPGIPVSSLEPLSNLRQLSFLDISSSGVQDFSALSSLKELNTLHAENTSVTSLSNLNELPNLEELRLDGTAIPDTAIIRFARLHPEALIIYKTADLQSWWSQLSEPWKEAFGSQTTIDNAPTTEQLHRLIGLSTVVVKDIALYEINPMKEFIRLREFEATSANIRSLSPLHFLDYLEKLRISRNPITDLNGLSSLKELKELDISNTPIVELKGLSSLRELERLNCSGTQIKNLVGLANLTQLQHLDCSNTAIKKLDEVSSLSLQTLNCYNTRISSKRIESFKQLNPECDVSYY